MRPVACEREASVVRLAREGRRDADLERHAAACPICRDALRIARLLGEVAARELAPALPDPGMLYWKAKLIERWNGERRATASLDRVQDAELALVAAGIVALLIWLWSSGGSWLAGSPASPLAVMLESLMRSGLVPLVAIGGGLIALTALVMFHTLLTDD